jgi:hypothetical protein
MTPADIELLVDMIAGTVYVLHQRDGIAAVTVAVSYERARAIVQILLANYTLTPKEPTHD